MIYVITNGEQYIRTNPNGRLAWSGNPTLANSFETFPAALGFLKTKRVQNTYYGDAELDLENIANVLQSANKILSNLDRYYESIKYLEREMDLRIFDIRHTLVEDETKLSGVAMQRGGYYGQQVDQYRKKIKRNRLILELIKDDINKIKDKNLSNEIHKIMTTPHKPRRISKSLFIDYCNGKYRKEKKHETKRVSKTIRTGVQ